MQISNIMSSYTYVQIFQLSLSYNPARSSQSAKSYIKILVVCMHYIRGILRGGTRQVMRDL